MAKRTSAQPEPESIRDPISLKDHFLIMSVNDINRRKQPVEYGILGCMVALRGFLLLRGPAANTQQIGLGST